MRNEEETRDTRVVLGGGRRDSSDATGLANFIADSRRAAQARMVVRRLELAAAMHDASLAPSDSDIADAAQCLLALSPERRHDALALLERQLLYSGLALLDDLASPMAASLARLLRGHLQRRDRGAS